MNRSATYTADFRHEFTTQITTLLRTRFLWFVGMLGGIAAIGVAVQLTLAPADQEVNAARAWLVLHSLNLIVCISCFAQGWRQQLDLDKLLRLGHWLIVVYGLTTIIGWQIDEYGNGGGPMRAIWIIMAIHMLAAALLPWNPRQAIRPFVLILVFNAAAIMLFGKASLWGAFWLIALSPLFGLPGVGFVALRHSRRLKDFKLNFLQRRYGEMRRELTDARKIHESLFPEPCLDGPVRFEYRYEPMRQIGGDFLHAFFSPGEEGQRALNLVVMDVTGHGIPAALTVNRLHGELDRIFAEYPHAGPGQVLQLLNRYVYLTLAAHALFVTAFCVKVDPTTGKLEYASGGHPPAFLRAVDGSIEELHSTSFVLGACPDEDFDPEPKTLTFGPGDALIAYTDGATESRNVEGQMLGTKGLQKLIAFGRPADKGGWAESVVRAVDDHRYGPSTDDTLVIEIVRPLDLKQAEQKTARLKTSAAAQPT